MAYEGICQVLSSRQKKVLNKFFFDMFRIKECLMIGLNHDFVFAQWLFLRSVAFLFFLHFVSLDRQVLALYGSEGITPLYKIINSIKRRGKLTLLKYPSVFLFCSTDHALKFMTRMGLVFSVTAFLGIYPTLIGFSLERGVNMYPSCPYK